MDKFLIPSFEKIVTTQSKEQPNTEQFRIEKLDRGFGNTIGNSMRRTLLSSIPGAAMFAIEVKGVSHEFQAVPSVSEDMVEIILNLKDVVIGSDTAIIKADELYEGKLVSKKGTVKAKDIQLPVGLEIANPEYVIAETNADAALEITFYIIFSKGFRTFEENRILIKELIGKENGVIPMDSNFSPVEKVNVTVQEANPGEARLYERLLLDVTTKPSMEPEKAVAYAGAILRTYFNVFESLTEVAVDEYFSEEVNVEEEDQQLSIRIDDLNLSVRSENALKAAGVYSVEELIDITISSLQAIKNLGEKSRLEIIEVVKEMGLSFKSE